MSDPFDLLGLPRQPWLEPDDVRRAFQEKARELHPDREGGSAEKFAELNAARAALVDTPSRLLALIGERAVIPTMPPDIELGFRVAAGLREAEVAMGKNVAHALGKALLAVERKATERKLAALASELAEKSADAERRVRNLGLESPEALAALAGEFLFLDRWAAQVRESRLQLQIGKPAGDA